MKLKIVITGSKVHDVGYRVFLLKHALNLAIPGLMAYNWDKEGQQVIALVEGEESRINAFKEIVAEKRPALAKVSEVTFESYDGEVGRASELAMLCSFVQLDKAIPLLLQVDGSLQRVEEHSQRMEGHLQGMDGNLQRMEESQRDIVDEIRGLRGDLTFNREWQAKIERDIRQIKSELGIK